MKEMAVGTGRGGLEDLKPALFCFGENFLIAILVGIEAGVEGAKEGLFQELDERTIGEVV